MNYKILFISSLFFLIGCSQIPKELNKTEINFEKRYTNSGFALIFDENLKKIKKLDDRSLMIYHKSLKRKSTVKITNPKNGKFLIAEVKSNNQKFSDFYNSIISKRIAEDLDLDFDEPLLEIVLVSKNSTFIAKKSKTFDEEKKVAEKAPIDGIQIKDLNPKTKKIKKNVKGKFSYSIKVVDFYYKDSAKMMISRIKNETNIKNSRILQLSKSKFRVLIGPFSDIKSLKESYEKLKLMNFENLEIFSNV
tara:strand:- start:115 stop:861 length:747 start_codon:yes stop_codon:yes gene_type:complete